VVDDDDGFVDEHSLMEGVVGGHLVKDVGRIVPVAVTVRGGIRIAVGDLGALSASRAHSAAASRSLAVAAASSSAL
jgi:hypothetical protein